MSSSKAILAGAVLIAASIIFVNTIPTAKASLGGPYQLMHHSNSNANAGVFRIDTSSGDVSYCYVTGASELVCTGAVR